MKLRRVVVTGIGIVSPVGSHMETAWQNVRDGVSGITPIADFDASTFPTQIAGQVRDFDADAYLSAKDRRKNDPFIHYGVAAAFDALDASGIEVTEESGSRIGVAMGAGIGGIKYIEDNSRTIPRRWRSQGVAVFHPRLDHQHDVRAGEHSA